MKKRAKHSSLGSEEFNSLTFSDLYCFHKALVLKSFTNVKLFGLFRNFFMYSSVQLKLFL